jgi:lysophospholipase L1-like esterase
VHPALKRIGALLVQFWLLFGLALLVLLIVDQILKAAFKPPKPERVQSGVVLIAREQMSLVQAESQYWKEHDKAKQAQWRSYVYFRREPYNGKAIQIDANGFRRTVSPALDSASAQSIWVFGASTVWGTGVSDVDTLPSRLNVAAKGAVHALNFGESGYVTMQSALAFQRALSCGTAPKLAVFIDGVNDVYSGLQHDRAGLPQNENNRIAEFNASQSPKSTFQALLAQLKGVQRARQRLSHANPPDRAQLAIEIAELYLRTIAQTRAIAHAHGARAIFIWQPSIFSKKYLSAEEQSIVANSELRHQQLQLKSTQALKARVQELGLVDVFVLDDLFDSYQESIYYDFSHTTKVGNDILAQWIWEKISLGVADQAAQQTRASTAITGTCKDLPVAALQNF